MVLESEQLSDYCLVLCLKIILVIPQKVWRLDWQLGLLCNDRQVSPDIWIFFY